MSKPTTPDEALFKAMDLAYNYGYLRSQLSPLSEFLEIEKILGRDPTQEEAVMFSRLRMEGFQKRTKEKLQRSFG